MFTNGSTATDLPDAPAAEGRPSVGVRPVTCIPETTRIAAAAANRVQSVQASRNRGEPLAAGSVRRTPSGEASKAHAMMRATGRPSISRTAVSVTVQAGSRSAGNRAAATWNTAQQVTA